MKETKQTETYAPMQTRDKFMGLMCFLAAGLLGYLLIHLVVLR
jgi:hypothetical protein